MPSRVLSKFMPEATKLDSCILAFATNTVEEGRHDR